MKPCADVDEPTSLKTPHTHQIRAIHVEIQRGYSRLGFELLHDLQKAAERVRKGGKKSELENERQTIM